MAGRFIVDGVTLELGEEEISLPEKLAVLLSLEAEQIAALRVLKKSLDARRNRPPYFVYQVEVIVSSNSVYPVARRSGIKITQVEEHGEGTSPISSICHATTRLKSSARPVIVGCGPAGLFAALVLALRGIPVRLVERGRPVEQRTKDVRLFWEQGILDIESNVLFGEGGAGTFSDGKLTSRVRSPYTQWVKEVLVEMGAPEAILTDAKPHIGTDRLRSVVINLRHRLLGLGCEISFGAKMTDIIVKDSALAGIVVNDKEIATGHLILAIGQSADDTYHILMSRDVHMVPKALAVGVRLEHPQGLIDKIQYGKWAGHPALPPAEYFLSAQIKEMNRSVYSFCMCPGGKVIGCSPQPGLVITNGMSNSHRSGAYANSAILVSVTPDDFSEKGSSPLQGLVFRNVWERKAYLAAGEDYFAPAQRLIDFVKSRESAEVGMVTYLPGVRPVPMSEVLPPFITEALKKGLTRFGELMPGFVSSESHLIGVETRSSSPVRIVRGPDGQSISVAGIYPCGEGAGYAGGIISSILDGIRAA
ncbi:MAG: FAD-dependent monooxygenase, partial [Smithellaceae bacterium]|nr:FAD-dependent monooxygenase [Smithellaceae bacterium]